MTAICEQGAFFSTDIQYKIAMYLILETSYLSLFPSSDVTAHAQEGPLPVKGCARSCGAINQSVLQFSRGSRVISHGSNDWLKKVCKELSTFKQRWQHATTQLYSSNVQIKIQ